MVAAATTKRGFGRKILVVVASTLLVVILLLLAPFWKCRGLIVSDLLPFRDVQFPVPSDCVPVSEAPPASVLEFMEKRRTSERLDLVKVATCRTHQSVEAVWQRINDDHRWLPSYLPGPYQYRRFVVLPATFETPNGTEVVVELCTKSRWRYYEQIVGDCEKFAVWK